MLLPEISEVIRKADLASGHGLNLLSRAQSFTRSNERALLYASDVENDRCRTAFAVKFEIEMSEWAQVLEVSKLGPLAKVYWMKSGWIGTSYRDTPPDGVWDVVDIASQLARRLPVDVLPGALLQTSIPESLVFETPVGSAETVDDALFYYDGRYL